MIDTERKIYSIRTITIVSGGKGTDIDNVHVSKYSRRSVTNIVIVINNDNQRRKRNEYRNEMDIVLDRR